MQINKYHSLCQIIGEKLSAVAFLLDYCQIQFDGSQLNLMTPITVITKDLTTKTGDIDFRNHICNQIEKVVQDITMVEKSHLSIIFQDNSELKISFCFDDYTGPEAVYCQGSNNEIVVI